MSGSVGAQGMNSIARPDNPKLLEKKWRRLTADNRLLLLEGSLHAGFTVNHHLFAVSINLLNT